MKKRIELFSVIFVCLKGHLVVCQGVAAGMFDACNGRFVKASTASTSGPTDGLLLLVP